MISGNPQSPAAAIPLLLLAACLPSALAEMPREAGFPGKIQLPAKTRGEAAITALGKDLPELAAYYGKSPQQLRDILRKDDSLWVDPTGALFFACPPQCEHCAGHEESPQGSTTAEIGPTDPGPFDTAMSFQLHSRPGANRVIYLDFDGHVDNTPGNWKDGASAPPYNIPNSDPNSFSTEERNRIIEIWQRVAEDFSLYEINVTTEEPDLESLRKTSSGDARYGIRVVIGGSGLDWYGGNVGGVAFVGSFDSSQDVPCWVFPAGSGSSAKNIAEAASHEAGHTLGLFHDGIEGGAGYYSGQGNWGPIMGVSYSKPISQWSKGEYANPSNTQDDLAVMLTQGAVYRPDDHGGSLATASELTGEGGSASAAGVIERSTDLDFFQIAAAGGALEIQVTPAPKGPNLRLQVRLFDAAGALLQSATATDTSAGTQPVRLSRSVSAGPYFVSVDGIGNGDPLTTGYTDYASLGQYTVAVTGLVPGGFLWQPVAAGTYPWFQPSHWAAGIVPNGPAVVTRIHNDITGNQTIPLTGPVTLGRLFLGDANHTHATTLAAAGGSLIFDNSGSPASLNKTTGGNDVISAPVSLAGPLDVNQSASSTLEFTGGISGTGAWNKNGAGTVVFGSANTYSGQTTLSGGLLRLDAAGGLPGGIDHSSGAGESLLRFQGGVLGLASGDFTRQIGTAAGQVHWDPDTGGAGSGGFAAFGADRKVRLNNSASSLSWATSFLGAGSTLLLSHPEATHTIDFQNGISFSIARRTVHVEDGEAEVDAVLSGVLAGSTNGGWIKTGPGVVSLTNTNTYPAATTVAQGVLRLQNAGALPDGNLELTGGGILGLGAADWLDRSIGTGNRQLRWTGDGGFAAFGADRAVRFTADPATSLNWTASNFIGTGRTLILGHDTADATLLWQQRISLAGSPRTVQVEDGRAPIDAKMSAIIAGGSSSNTNNRFNKTGAGTLALTAQNSHWGDTIVSGGTLMIGDGGNSGGVSMNSAEIVVEAGATLAVNRSDTVTQGSNPFAAPVHGEGGFTQAGPGNTILTLANRYIGPTRIDAGTLTLAHPDVLPDGSEIILGKATLAVAAAGETAGRLDLEGMATIHLAPASRLAFASSAEADWTGGTLELTGTFTPAASLRFGTDRNGLHPSQLALLSADGFTDFTLDAAGFLDARPLSGFERWISGSFANGQLPPDLRGPNDDADHDGLPNLVEYALAGQDPTRADPPTGTLTGNTLTFPKRPDATGLVCAIEVSSDLGQSVPWTQAQGETYIENANLISYTFPAVSPRVFLRLRVTLRESMP